MKIGFIGTGVMGRSMAGHLLAAGHRLHVYTRTKAKAEELLARGASWQPSPAALAAQCDIVVTIVGYPSDVKEIYLGEGGLVANGTPGATFIDMTTSSPALARRIHAAAAGRGIEALDAPVSGGDIGAREARLSIMVGGSRAAFEAMKPAVFDALGKNVVLQGGPGSGQHAKMCNQIAIAGGMMGVCEALAYAKEAGLDPNAVLASIESGAAGSWSLSNLGPRIVAGNYEPGFYVKHFIKDMQIALDSAEEMGLELPGLALARTLYERLSEMGYAEKGTQALYRLYER